MDDVRMGIAIGSAASMLVTFGMGIGLFRAKVGKLTLSQDHLAEVLAAVAEQQRETANVLKEMVGILVHLNEIHTPERADGSGFGTGWLHNPINDLIQGQASVRDHAKEARAEHSKAHDEIVGLLRGLKKAAIG